MKVNMTPNPLDVVTIHASQGDTEARQWEFELHNNGELIDTSEITEQLFFKAYKGGTEQLLPENTSTPTTSPFKGDIRYPQGLLTNQEFTYRQSTTESDGLAKITDIKGNTIVWNQLAENGNFANGVGRWTTGGANTLSVTDGVCKIQSKNTSTNNHHIVFPDPSIFQNNHTYLVGVSARAYGNYIGGNLYLAQQTNIIGIGTLIEVMSSSWQRGWLLFNRNDMTLTNGKRLALGGLSTVTTDDYFEVKDIVVFDLTQMGLDISSPSDFTSLFPLPYYAYNQGTLLSFNGNGIKTVGKNQFKLNPSATSSNIINVIDEATGAVDVADSTAIRWSTPYIGYTDVVAGQTYTASLKGGVTLIYGRIGGSTTTGQPSSSNQPYTSIGGAITSLITNLTPSRSFVANETQRIYWYYCTDSGNANHQEFTFYPQIEHGSTVTDFEPYTSSTLSLPISTYFSTGMKSAGSVYDELTETKAITRVGEVDLGTLTWNKGSALSDGSGTDYYTNINLYPSAFNGAEANIVSSMFIGVPYRTTWESISKGQMFEIGNGRLVVGADSSYADGNAFKTAMSGVYLYFELATYEETSFTTASLVTENGEIPLSNEDGVLIGKCTEELSENPGFFDAKIKLADEDGECYSNKIQLHIERSPQ